LLGLRNLISPRQTSTGISSRHVKPVQQGLHVFLAIEVDVRVWMNVAGQEFLDAQRPAQ
jgi:hypothetical protein